MEDATSSLNQGRDKDTSNALQSPNTYHEAQYLFPSFQPCRYTNHPEVPSDQRWPTIEELVERPGASTFRSLVDKPNVFPYPRLPPGHSVRFIRLQSGQGDEPISCSLVTANIDHDLQYEAISYVWGDVWEQAKIFLNGIPFKVTKNLYAALQCIRSVANEKVLWADSICINQEDLAERSAQVQKMRDIYGRARLIYVWLGPKDPRDEEAVALINRLAEKYLYLVPNPARNYDLRVLAQSIPLSSLPDQGSSEWESLFRFFELPYFCRTWIIQEIQANNNCLVICGQSRTTFLAIELLAFCALRAPEAVRDKMITDRGISNATYIRSLAVPNTSLMTRLEQTRGFFATDPRDKVFAFLRQEDKLAPDYTMSLKDVLLSTSSQILREDGLDGLSRVFHRTLFWFEMGKASFPSWIPTFTNCFIVPLYKIRGLAAGGLSNSQDFAVENEELKMKAIFLDRIAIIHPSLCWNDLSVMPSVRKIPTHVGRLWHLYLAGLGRWGLEPDVRAHETAFVEFTKLLFTRAGDMKLRLYEEHSQQDGVEWHTNCPDLVDSEILHINYNGGGQAPHEYEEWQESKTSTTSKPMPIYQRFQRAAQSACNNRCVFETQKGYLGLGPSAMESFTRVGWDKEMGRYPEAHEDESNIYEVWIPLGAKTPFVLKPRGSSYIMVGECYVQGMMDGEVLNNGMREVQEIRLC